jgi:hypothetical protein
MYEAKNIDLPERSQKISVKICEKRGARWVKKSRNSFALKIPSQSETTFLPKVKANPYKKQTKVSFIWNRIERKWLKRERRIIWSTSPSTILGFWDANWGKGKTSSVVCTAEEEAIHVLHHTILELSASIIYYTSEEAIRHQKMGQNLWKNSWGKAKIIMLNDWKRMKIKNRPKKEEHWT